MGNTKIRLPLIFYRKFGQWGAIPFLALSLFSAYFLPKLSINPDLNIEIPGISEYFEKLETAQSGFSSADYIAVSLAFDDPYNPEAIGRVHDISEAFRNIPEIKTILSITTLTDFTSAGEGLTTRPLVEFPLNEKSIEDLKSIINATSLFKKYLLSENGRAWTILLFPRNPEEYLDLTESIYRIIGGADNIYITGYPAFHYHVFNATRSDFFKLILFGLLIVLGIEIIICRDLKIGILLWISAIIPVLWVLALFPIFGFDLTLETIIVPIIVLCLSTSYGIHIIRYYSSDPDAGLEGAIDHTTPIVFLAGTTTVIGFASLLISRLPGLRNLGLFVIFGIYFAMAAALYLFPALVRKRSARIIRSGSIGFLNRSGKFYFLTFIILILVLGLSMYGIGNVSRRYSIASLFKPNSNIIESIEHFTEYDGGIEKIEVIVDTGKEYGLINLDNYLAVKQTIREIGALQGVRDVLSVIDFIEWLNGRYTGRLSPMEPRTDEEIGELLELLYGGAEGMDISSIIDMNYTKMKLVVRLDERGHKSGSPSHEKAIRETIGRLESFTNGLKNNNRTSAEIFLSGSYYKTIRIHQILTRDQIRGVVFFIPVLFAFLMIVLRSWKWSLIAILPPCMSLVFFFGLAGWLKFPLTGITSMTAAAVLGVTVDDVIYILLFYRKMRESMAAREAVETTLKKAGIAVIQTTLVISAGLVVLLFSYYRVAAQSALITIAALIFGTLVTIFFIPGVLLTVERKADEKP
jgi:uncharacterized protein